ncbi:MAG: AbrB family transcriptional regulator, partial [Candidatus Spyradocola sp.]
AIGLLLHALGVSAGAMIGAMVGSATYCILKGKQKYPAALKTALQLCSGAYIGCRIDRATILGFGGLLLPLLVMLLGIFAFTFMTSSLMCRLSRLSRSTAMLASTPGGIQEMSLLSEELGADTPSVAVLHTARIVFVILCFPTLIQLLLRLIPN